MHNKPNVRYQINYTKRMKYNSNENKITIVQV